MIPLPQLEILYGKLHIHHATSAVLDIKQMGFDRPSGTQLVAHGKNLLRQGRVIARSMDDTAPHGLKTRAQLW